MNDSLTEYLIDVRSIPPRDRHPKIFGTWAELGNGETILLVNDHDPVPLYYQFAAEHTGAFRWEYLEQGPDIFRVRITKGDFAEAGFVPAARPKHSCATAKPAPIAFVKPLLLDTRPIFACGETPGEAIDKALASLLPGQPLVITVPFEPIPLYARLGKQGFTHQTKRIDGGSWQVEFRKGSG